MREALDIIESLWPDSLFYAVAKKPDTDIDDIVAAAKRPLSNHTFTIEDARKQSTRLGWLIPRGVLVVDIDDMAAYAPAKIICAEQGFADESALSNAHYILRDKQIELKLV